MKKPSHAVFAWGVLGFAAILIQAVVSLFPMAVAPIRDGSLDAVKIALYVAWVAFMAYSEGYKGFQKQMAPRVAVRGLYAATHRRPVLVVGAPLFVMGLFHATRRRLATSWIILVGVILLVIAVRQLEQPWRGIIDGGVVVGLAWGLAATLWYALQAILGRPPEVSPDVPPEVSPDVPPEVSPDVPPEVSPDVLDE